MRGEQPFSYQKIHEVRSAIEVGNKQGVRQSGRQLKTSSRMEVLCAELESSCVGITTE